MGAARCRGGAASLCSARAGRSGEDGAAVSEAAATRFAGAGGRGAYFGCPSSAPRGAGRVGPGLPFGRRGPRAESIEGSCVGLGRPGEIFAQAANVGCFPDGACCPGWARHRGRELPAESARASSCVRVAVRAAAAVLGACEEASSRGILTRRCCWRRFAVGGSEMSSGTGQACGWCPLRPTSVALLFRCEQSAR